jgi:hypothetical protein
LFSLSSSFPKYSTFTEAAQQLIMRFILLLFAAGALAAPSKQPRGLSDPEIDNIIFEAGKSAKNMSPAQLDILKKLIPGMFRCRGEHRKARWVEKNFKKFMAGMTKDLTAASKDSDHMTAFREQLKPNADDVIRCIYQAKADLNLNFRRSISDETFLGNVLDDAVVWALARKNVTADDDKGDYNDIVVEGMSERADWPSHRCVDICANIEDGEGISRCHQLCPRVRHEPTDDKLESNTTLTNIEKRHNITNNHEEDTVNISDNAEKRDDKVHLMVKHWIARCAEHRKKFGDTDWSFNRCPFLYKHLKEWKNSLKRDDSLLSFIADLTDTTNGVCEETPGCLGEIQKRGTDSSCFRICFELRANFQECMSSCAILMEMESMDPLAFRMVAAEVLAEKEEDIKLDLDIKWEVEMVRTYVKFRLYHLFALSMIYVGSY